MYARRPDEQSKPLRQATMELVRPLSCRYADVAGQAGMPMAVKVKAGAQAPA
jgi:hypothetical protein